MPLPFARSASQTRPTFSRDFAGLKTLDHGAGPAITFTRASNATFYDASGTLRLAPFNLLLHSEDFGNAAWDKVLGATVTTNNVAAPDGSTTADTINFTTSNTNRVDQLLGAAANGETWTFSVWLKGSGTVRILADTSSGVGGATEVNITLTSTWTRYSATVTYSSPTGNRRAAIIWRTGNTATSVDAWGAQFVSGSQAGEYFRTTNTAASMPRFDHDPATGASRGLLIEESRTNSIRNSQAGGAVAGTPGTLPTNWTGDPGPHGITRQVVGAGTENGLAYVDVKYSGTPSANGAFYPTPETGNIIAASSGQTWTFSVYVKLAAGSVANTVIRVYCSERGSGGNDIANTGATITPTTSSLASQRSSVTRAFNNASTNFALGFIGVDYTSGNPIDLTLRIAAPQLEQGAFPTSYIPTTTAAATRSADSAVVTPISSFYNQAEGTLFVEASTTRWTINSLMTVVAFDQAASAPDNTFRIIRNGPFGASANDKLISVYRSGVGPDVASLQSANGTWPINVAAKVASAYRTNDFAASLNGGSVLTDTSGALTTMDRMWLGNWAMNEISNGHIRKIAYYPKRLSNTLLQQLTT